MHRQLPPQLADNQHERFQISLIACTGADPVRSHCSLRMPLLLAGEIARALLYARPPEWADKEAVSIEQRASSQRFSALTALCEAAPQEVGPSAMDICAKWQHRDFA